MNDITELTKFASSTPEEAAENIDGGAIFNMPPDAFKEQRETLKPEFDEIRKPATAEPAVADYMRESPEHAALATPDSDNLSYMGRQMRLIWDHVTDRSTNERKIVELSLKRMNDPDNFSPDDDAMLGMLNEERATYANRNYGLDGPLEQLPAQIAQGVVDFGKSVGRNADIIAGATALGAAGGGAVGSVLPGIGTAAGALAGGGKGAFVGFEIAQFKDGYETMAGSTYNELSSMTGDDGQPLNINESTKANISRGVGLVSGVVSAVVGRAVAKNVTFLKNWMSPKLMRQVVLDPSAAAVRATLVRFGEAVGAGAAGGGLVEVSRILGEEMGRTYDGTEASFMNALEAASQKLGENAKRVGGAALVGGATAGTIAGVAGGVGLATGSTQRGFRRAQDTAVNAARDITPKPAGELPAPGAGSTETGSIPVDNGPVAPNMNRTEVTQAVNILQFQDALDNVEAAAKQTKMATIAPAQLSKLRQKIAEQIGFKTVHLDPEDIAAFSAKGEDKAEAVRNIIDPTGNLAAQMNAPVQVPAHKFMDLVAQYPDASEMAKLYPAAPNPRQAKTFFENAKQVAEKRNKIQVKLGAGEKSPEERAYAAKIHAEMSDADIAETLGSKEVIDAYLGRLDVVQSEIEGRMLDNTSTSRPEDAARLVDIENMRKRVTAMRDLAPADVDAKKMLEETLNTTQPDWSILSEQDLVDQPIFTDAIKEIVPKKEAARFTETVMEARQDFIDATNEAARLEMDQVKDVIAEITAEQIVEQETIRLQNDPNLQIVDRFTLAGDENKFYPDARRPDKAGTLYELTENHAKKGYSPFAIDPRSLPKKLQKWVGNAQLKKHKAFVEGGITADESARLLGVNGGENLLKILAATPSREDLLARAKKLAEKEGQDVADASVDLNQTALAKTYNKQMSVDFQLLKHMRTKNWTDYRGQIVRIALGERQIESFTAQARNAVKQMKVSDLNVQTFKVGERRSRRLALNGILKKNPQVAYTNQEAVIRNLAMQKEVSIGIGQVNRATKFFRKMKKKERWQELESAGSMYVNAMKELMDVFNFDPSLRGQADKDAYIKWAQKMFESGNGEFEIPERFADPRASLNDMTVETVALVHERAKSILHTARKKNKLYKKFREQELIQTTEAIAQAVLEKAQQHPDFDLNRSTPGQGALTPSQEGAVLLSGATSLISNAEHILTTLDQETPGGFFHELFWQRLKGDGKFAGAGESGVVADEIAFRKEFEKHVEAYGKKDFEMLNSTIVEVPEFADVRSLNNGRMTKGELIMMQAYRGDPDGREALTNFGVSLDVIERVLERELEERDAVFVQNGILNGLKSYRDRVKALQTETGGSVQFIEGVPVVHRGKVYPGGWFRLRYLAPAEDRAIAEQLKVLTGMKEDTLINRPYGADMTDQSYLKERVGSKQELNLSMFTIGMTYKEIIHDLNMRIPIRDGLELLRNPTIKQSMVAIVGDIKYRQIVNAYIEAANSVEIENLNYFNDQNRFVKATFGHFQSGFAVSVLGANITSVLMQPISFAFALEKMGPKGGLHMINVLLKMGTNPGKLGAFYDLASEIHPPIRKYMEQIDESATNSITDLLPRKRIFPKMAPIERAQKLMVSSVMSPLGFVDQISKVTVALTAYEQFINGDAPGFTKAQVMAMDGKARHDAAVAYARQIARTTLTSGEKSDQAPIQKLPLGTFFVRFWNDLRNQLNNMMSSGRRIKYQSKKSAGAAKKGNYGEAGKYAAGAVGTAMGVIVINTIAKVWGDKLRGRETPLEENFDFSTTEGQAAAADYMFKYMLSAPVENFFGSIPVVRDISWAMSKESKFTDRKEVQIPVIKTASDLATAGAALRDLLFFDLEMDGVSDEQKKAIAFSASYLTGGFPINALYKYNEVFEDKFGPVDEVFSRGVLSDTSKAIKDYIKKSEDTDVPPEFLQQLEELDQEMMPPPEDTTGITIPPDSIDVIRNIESGGKWWAKNPNSSAAGLYQFTEDTWAAVMEQAPQLELTTDGRVSSDTSQQEKAMEWLTQQNAGRLRQAEVPITTENLYAMHFLGAGDGIRVLRAPKSTKLKTLVSADVMRSNGFRGTMKVKDFHTWIQGKVEKAREGSTETVASN